MSSSPLVSPMVCPSRLGAKTMVSRACAVASRAQRAGSAVQVVHDGQRAEHFAAFERFGLRPKSNVWLAHWGASCLRPVSHPLGQPRKPLHELLLSKTGVESNENAIRPAGRTERRNEGWVGD